MKIDKNNRSLYEGTDVVSRDGFELDDNLGDVFLKSLWVKGDIVTPNGSHLLVEDEIFITGKNKALGGFESNEFYVGKTMLDEIKFQDDLKCRFPQLSSNDICSICFR